MSILQTHTQDKIFAFLTTTLRAAGDAITAARGHDLHVRRKKDKSVVSAADLASNTVIQDLLQTHYPDDQIISEEQELQPELSPDRAVWVIDPLDGTSNFINGYPFFCVSIALMEIQNNGLLASRAGGIFDPNADKVYLAYRGGGAFCNNTQIKVADERAFADCFLVTSLCTGGDAKICSEIASSVSSVRADGASALDLALVAEGVYDGLWQIGLKLWDIAAGYLLVTEAGGAVFNNYMSGNAHDFDPLRGDIIAGNHATATRLVTMTG